MPHIILPDRWRRQPNRIVGLNFTHPALANVPIRFPGYTYRPSGVAWCASHGVRPLWPDPTTTTPAYGWPFMSMYKTKMIGTDLGPALDTNTTGACLNFDYIMGYGDVSVLLAFLYRTAREAYPRIVDMAGCYAMGAEGTNDIVFSNAAGTNLTSSSVLTPGRCHVLAYSAKWSITGTPVNAFLNGHDITPSGTNGQAIGLASSQFTVGNGGNDGGRTWDGAFALALVMTGVVWNKGILQTLSENPWQIFRRAVPRTYFFPAGGGSSTYPWTATGGAVAAGAAITAKSLGYGKFGGIMPRVRGTRPV